MSLLARGVVGWWLVEFESWRDTLVDASAARSQPTHSLSLTVTHSLTHSLTSQFRSFVRSFLKWGGVRPDCNKTTTAPRHSHSATAPNTRDTRLRSFSADDVRDGR